jgi:hypothetical protein
VLAAAADHPSIHTLVTIGAPGLRGGAATAQLGMLPALRAVHLHSKAGSFGAHALALLPSLRAPGTAVSELLLQALGWAGPTAGFQQASIVPDHAGCEVSKQTAAIVMPGSIKQGPPAACYQQQTTLGQLSRLGLRRLADKIH